MACHVYELHVKRYHLLTQDRSRPGSRTYVKAWQGTTYPIRQNVTDTHTAKSRYTPSAIHVRGARYTPESSR